MKGGEAPGGQVSGQDAWPGCQEAPVMGNAEVERARRCGVGNGGSVSPTLQVLFAKTWSGVYRMSFPCASQVLVKFSTEPHMASSRGP